MTPEESRAYSFERKMKHLYQLWQEYKHLCHLHGTESMQTGRAWYALERAFKLYAEDEDA